MKYKEVLDLIGEVDNIMDDNQFGLCLSTIQTTLKISDDHFRDISSMNKVEMFRAIRGKNNLDEKRRKYIIEHIKMRLKVVLP